jgi:hypothetical protein
MDYYTKIDLILKFIGKLDLNKNETIYAKKLQFIIIKCRY